MNIVTLSSSSYSGLQALDVSSWAANQQNVSFRFRYFDAKNQIWWQVDDFILAGGLTPIIGPGSISFPSAAITVNENEGWDSKLYSIRSGGVDGYIWAPVVVAGGTAQAGMDYSPNSDAHLYGGERQHTLHFYNRNDSLVEGDETLVLQLTNPQNGATLGAITQMVVTIVDDDRPMSDMAVSLLNAPNRAVKGMPQNIGANVVNLGPLPTTNVVLTYTYPEDRLSIATATTTKGSVTQEPGLVTFLIGSMSVNEQVICNLTRFPLVGGDVASRFALTSGNYDQRPLNNQTDLTTYVESPGVFGFAVGSVQLDENGAAVTVPVVRSQGSEGAVSVSYQTVAATALAPADYPFTSGLLNFADGEVARNVTIPITDDTLFEGTEHFLVQLLNPTGGAGLTPTPVLAVNIRDDETFTSFVSQGFGGSGPARRLLDTTPPGWNVQDWAESGAVWRFDDPASRTNRTGGGGGFAIADSLYFGETNMNTQLLSPAYNMSTTLTVSLEFKTAFQQGTNGLGQVYVNTGGPTGMWSMVWETRGEDLPGPQTVHLDITPFAAANTDVVVAFNYFLATNSGWWQVDDVRIYGEPDSDTDGMPDWWELRHYGSPTGATAGVDTDDDGLLDEDEFLADTDPTNDVSIPVLFIAADTNGAPILEFGTSPLRLYDLQGSASLSTDVWEEITSGMLGNGGILSATDDLSTTQRIYRLRVRR